MAKKLLGKVVAGAALGGASLLVCAPGIAVADDHHRKDEGKVLAKPHEVKAGHEVKLIQYCPTPQEHAYVWSKVTGKVKLKPAHDRDGKDYGGHDWDSGRDHKGDWDSGRDHHSGYDHKDDYDHKHHDYKDDYNSGRDHHSGYDHKSDYDHKHHDYKDDYNSGRDHHSGYDHKSDYDHKHHDYKDDYNSGRDHHSGYDHKSDYDHKHHDYKDDYNSGRDHHSGYDSDSRSDWGNDEEGRRAGRPISTENTQAEQGGQAAGHHDNRSGSEHGQDAESGREGSDRTGDRSSDDRSSDDRSNWHGNDQSSDNRSSDNRSSDDRSSWEHKRDYVYYGEAEVDKHAKPGTYKLKGSCGEGELVVLPRGGVDGGDGGMSAGANRGLAAGGAGLLGAAALGGLVLLRRRTDGSLV